MLEVEIDYYKSKELFEQLPEEYDKLMDMNKELFIQKPECKWFINDKGQSENKGYSSIRFYINDFKDINPLMLKFCIFEPVKTLEMMGGARINTENVFESIKRNQIMLPNNLMLDMKELLVETNACTDIINGHLKEGWKLIAVLPQHQQSRPDYILGKI